MGFGLNSHQVMRIAREVYTGEPPSLIEPENQRAFRDQLVIGLEEMLARGVKPEIPYEIPGFDDDDELWEQ